MSTNYIKLAKLPWTVGAKELATYCSSYGPVSFVRVPVNYRTGFQYGVAFVQFADSVSKGRFLEKQHTIEGHKIAIDVTSSPKL